MSPTYIAVSSILFFKWLKYLQPQLHAANVIKFFCNVPRHTDVQTIAGKISFIL